MKLKRILSLVMAQIFFCVHTTHAQNILAASWFDYEPLIGFTFTCAEEMRSVAIVTQQDDTVFITKKLHPGDRISVSDMPQALLYCPCKRSIAAIQPVIISYNCKNVVSHFTSDYTQDIEEVIVDSLGSVLYIHNKRRLKITEYYLGNIISNNYALIIITPE